GRHALGLATGFPHRVDELADRTFPLLHRRHQLGAVIGAERPRDLSGVSFGVDQVNQQLIQAAYRTRGVADLDAQLTEHFGRIGALVLKLTEDVVERRTGRASLDADVAEQADGCGQV